MPYFTRQTPTNLRLVAARAVVPRGRAPHRQEMNPNKTEKES
jgi:hypothetical protein